MEKSGSWYSFKGERIGQGRDAARQTLLARPEICSSVEATLRVKLGLPLLVAEKKAPEFELSRPEAKRAAAAS